MTEQAEIPDEPHADGSKASGSPVKRVLIGSFALVCFGVIAIDTLPGTWPIIGQLKPMVGKLINPVGLWQGEWPLFAPDPKVNNAWITAEIHSPDGGLEFWNSAYWADKSSYDKFRNFRLMNFSTRIPINGQAAINDYCDYLAAQEIQPGLIATAYDPESSRIDERPAGPVWRIRLYRNALEMVQPQAVELPSREEAVSVATTRLLAEREYRQP